MTPSPDFSYAVVVPALNAVATIFDQLAEIDRQVGELPIGQIVVVDNGSTDGTLEALRDWASSRSHVSVLDGSRLPRGGAAAKNAGVLYADAELVVFVDADDLIGSGYVRAMVVAAASAGGPVVARREYSRLAGGAIANASRDESKFNGIGVVPGGAFAMRRDAYIAAGMFDSLFRGAVDTEFGMRLHSLGFEPPVSVPAAVLHCRTRSSSSDVFRRARQLSASKARIHRRYVAPCAPPRRKNLRRLVAVTKAMLVGVVRARGNSRAAVLGDYVGRLEGWWKYRTLR